MFFPNLSQTIKGAVAFSVFAGLTGGVFAGVLGASLDTGVNNVQQTLTDFKTAGSQTTLDWAFWGRGTNEAGDPLPTPSTTAVNSMRGGSGIHREITLTTTSTVSNGFENTNWTGVEWSWNDGELPVTGSHQHGQNDSGAGMRAFFNNGDSLEFTFAGASAGKINVATLLFRSGVEDGGRWTIEAIQSGDAVTVVADLQNQSRNFLTVLYDGADALKIRLTLSGSGAVNDGSNYLRGFAATLGAMPAGQQDAILPYVRRYADCLLRFGTDRYGAQHSPLFATALTRELEPQLVPASPKINVDSGMDPDDPPVWPPRWRDLPNVFVGSDHAHKITIRGADIATETGLIKALHQLSSITGDPRYASAADACLGWFIENTQDPVTGLLPWGEHTGWDFREENRIDGDIIWPQPEHHAQHEFQNPMDLNSILDAFFFIPPNGAQAMSDYARGLWTQHFFTENGKTRYSRHAQFGTVGNEVAVGDQGMYPRVGGMFLEIWAAVYQWVDDAATRAEVLGYIEALLEEMEDLVATHGYYPSDITSDNLNHWQNDDLAGHLRNAALRLRSGQPALAGEMVSLAQTLEDFLADEGEPAAAYARIEPFMSQEIPDRDLGKNTRDRNDYVKGSDLPGRIPLQFAEVILDLLQAAQEQHPDSPRTAAEYLARAEYFGQQAIDLFIDDGKGSPLPRMLDKESEAILHDESPAEAFYHSYTGGSELMWALLNLAIAREEASLPEPRMHIKEMLPDGAMRLQIENLRFGQPYLCQWAIDLDSHSWNEMYRFTNVAPAHVMKFHEPAPQAFVRLRNQN